MPSLNTQISIFPTQTYSPSGPWLPISQIWTSSTAHVPRSTRTGARFACGARRGAFAAAPPPPLLAPAVDTAGGASASGDAAAAADFTASTGSPPSVSAPVSAGFPSASPVRDESACGVSQLGTMPPSAR
jgi:hypothetical protein